MLHRTLSEAQRESVPAASWKTKVILACTLDSGLVYYRTYVFDAANHRCKRCRKARTHGQDHVRLTCTGHTCERCGNPFAAFTRQLRRRTSAGWETVRHAWTDTGRLH